MEFAQLLAKQKGTPVLCADGGVGLLARCPPDDAPLSAAAVQVAGERKPRSIARQALHGAGGALCEQGAPAIHTTRIVGDPAVRMDRALATELWSALQPLEQRDASVAPALARAPPAAEVLAAGSAPRVA